MTFRPALLAGEITLPELFEWGAEKGFNWVEVRDFKLSFSETELLAIKTDAGRCGLRVHYAWDTTSAYKAEDRERFLQGIRNAAFFGDGTCSRIVIAPELINAGEGKIGYSRAEFQSLEKHLCEYCRYAADRGVTLTFENSLETLSGFEAFLDAEPEMRMTLDTANTFNSENTGAELTWPAFREFIIRRKGQIPYVHLKSSRDGVTVPDLLENGDVPLAELIGLIQQDAWLCVELPMHENLSFCMSRVSAGRSLLRTF